jgi:hypothetical protein
MRSAGGALSVVLQPEKIPIAAAAASNTITVFLTDFMFCSPSIFILLTNQH